MHLHHNRVVAPVQERIREWVSEPCVIGHDKYRLLGARVWVKLLAVDTHVKLIEVGVVRQLESQCQLRHKADLPCGLEVLGEG